MDIWDKEDMEIFREKVKEGKIFVSTTAKVMDNIELGGEKWEPIATAKKPFFGNFEGNGYRGGYAESSYVSEETLKTYINNLGEQYFTEDDVNLNKGFPILKWEKE